MTSMSGEEDVPLAVPDAPAVEPAAPRMIGQWEVEKQIGRGSFAVVWRARHVTSRVKVAIKEIKLEKLNRKLRESLESEISVLQRSKHDNIIKLHEIIKEERRIFLVLEYCAGGDVSEFLKRQGRVTEAVARHFMIQIAAGLQAMRAQNLIHRDLKPQNLLLTTAVNPMMQQTQQNQQTKQRRADGDDLPGESGDENLDANADANDASATGSGHARGAGGAGVTLKIADFGFARYMHPTGRESDSRLLTF